MPGTRLSTNWRSKSHFIRRSAALSFPVTAGSLITAIHYLMKSRREKLDAHKPPSKDFYDLQTMLKNLRNNARFCADL